LPARDSGLVSLSPVITDNIKNRMRVRAARATGFCLLRWGSQESKIKPHVQAAKKLVPLRGHTCRFGSSMKAWFPKPADQPRRLQNSFFAATSLTRPSINRHRILALEQGVVGLLQHRALPAVPGLQPAPMAGGGRDRLPNWRSQGPLPVRALFTTGFLFRAQNGPDPTWPRIGGSRNGLGRPAKAK